MSKDWYDDILEWSLKFGQCIMFSPSVPTDTVQRLRRKLIREEVNELLDAIDDNNIVSLADAVADSIVVILGTAIAYGIDIRPIWDEVHKTNMAKIGGGSRFDGKILKPENWQPPRIKELIQKQMKGG